MCAFQQTQRGDLRNLDRLCLRVVHGRGRRGLDGSMACPGDGAASCPLLVLCSSDRAVSPANADMLPTAADLESGPSGEAVESWDRCLHTGVDAPEDVRLSSAFDHAEQPDGTGGCGATPCPSKGLGLRSRVSGGRQMAGRVTPLLTLRDGRGRTHDRSGLTDHD